MQTGFAGKGSDYLQLIKFWPSRAPGKGSAAGRKFLAAPYYYSQRAVFASPPSAFSLYVYLNRLWKKTYNRCGNYRGLWSLGFDPST